MDITETETRRLFPSCFPPLHAAPKLPHTLLSKKTIDFSRNSLRREDQRLTLVLPFSAISCSVKPMSVTGIADMLGDHVS